MKWIEILRKDDYALLQSESDTQYVVASGYNPDAEENQMWTSGTYFTYWESVECKAECLQAAWDTLINMTCTPKCERVGFCTEKRSCGYMPPKEEVMNERS